jgi:hypothetical protein
VGLVVNAMVGLLADNNDMKFKQKFDGMATAICKKNVVIQVRNLTDSDETVGL